MVYSCTQGQLVHSSSGPCSSSAGRNVKETCYFSLLQDASLSEEWVFPAEGHTSTQRNVAEREYKCMRQKAAVQDLNWDKSIGKEASWSTKPGMGRRQKQQSILALPTIRNLKTGLWATEEQKQAIYEDLEQNKIDAVLEEGEHYMSCC